MVTTSRCLRIGLLTLLVLGAAALIPPAAAQEVPAGIVLTSLGGGTAAASFRDAQGRMVVAARSGGNFAVLRYLPNGALDTSFGNGGWVITPVNKNWWDGPRAAALEPGTGKILLGGEAQMSQYRTDQALVRYKTDGSLDTQFNKKGYVTTYGPGSAIAVLPQSNGKIVTVDNNTSPNLVRYTSAGKLDTTFGSGGIVRTGLTARVYGATMHQGKILVVSVYAAGYHDFLLARFNLDGNLDASFGEDGMVIPDFGLGPETSVAVDGDGSIVVCGDSAEDGDWGPIVLARYDSSGTLDTTFGTNGLAVTDLGRPGTMPGAMAIDPLSGKIVVAGSTVGWDEVAGVNRICHLGVGRFNSDGSLDETFGTGGAVFTRILSEEQSPPVEAVSVLIQPQLDGPSKIVVVGRAADDSSGRYVFLARYNDDGSLDETFGP